MRLAAIYIHKHDFLFNEPQTINLGGKNIYKVEEKDNKFEVIIEKENSSFIDNFWGENISLVSAIVGENGTGKTSILKKLVLLFDEYRENKVLKNVALIYEINETEIRINTRLELIKEELKHYSFKDITTEYYNPVLDFDMINISGYINPSNIMANNSLEVFKLKILEYQLVFNYSSVSKSLKEKHKSNFPKFKDIIIKARLHYNQDYKKLYVLTNMQKGMEKFLDEVFKKYPNSTEGYTQFTHNQNDFIKNVEVNILAILATNNTYPVITGLGNPKYTINQILEGDDFLEILKRFKIQYIGLNSDVETFKKFEELDIQDFKQHLKTSFDNTVPSFLNLKRILDIFEAFENFYTYLTKIPNLNVFKDYENNWLYSNINDDDKGIISFVSIYRELIEQLNRLHVKEPSLLEFDYFDSKIGKKIILSSGEKALLNLYSIIYNYSMNSQIKAHDWKNFIFLLDEADLGFHPDWKKKFVGSIVNVLPELFNDVETFKNLQIIFTTHDPLTLSDIPNNNIVYLKKENGYTTVVDKEKEPQKSFGANITDLLADSFFFGNNDKSLIGDFAKGKINEVIRWLNDENRDTDKKDDYKKIIEMIDEPLIRRKLSEMYSNVMSESFELELINKEIELLERRKQEIKKV